MLYISHIEQWPITVEAQGKHSIPVDIDAIKKLFEGQFSKKVIESLNSDYVRSVSDLGIDMIVKSFFSKGNWILNLDRTRLQTSPERNGTMRVFESEINNSLFVIVQTLDGERRKGLLHPPSNMTNAEKLECSIFLQTEFNPRNVAVQLTGGGLASTANAVSSEYFSGVAHGIGKKQASPELIIARDCRTALRSKARKMKLIELFCDEGGSADEPLSQEACYRVLDRFWSEIRSNRNTHPSKLTRSMLFTTAEATGMLVETAYSQLLALGEVAEIYFEEFEEEIKKRKHEQLESRKQQLNKEISRCKNRLVSLREDTDKTTQQLQAAERELNSLVESN